MSEESQETENHIGRNLVTINWQVVEDLLTAGCLGTEIAGHFGIHPNTLYRRVEEEYKMSFSDYSSQKKSKGEALLRLQQFGKALGITKKGDNTMLVWLGKQRLSQRENQDITFSNNPNDILNKIAENKQPIE